MNKITQSDIIDLLEKEEKPLSRSEIAQLITDSVCKVSKDLNKLLKYHEINFIEISAVDAKKYHSNRRMKLYFAKKEVKKKNGSR